MFGIAQDPGLDAFRSKSDTGWLPGATTHPEPLPPLDQRAILSLAGLAGVIVLLAGWMILG